MQTDAHEPIRKRPDLPATTHSGGYPTPVACPLFPLENTYKASNAL